MFVGGLAAVFAVTSAQAAVVEYSETFSTDNTIDGWYLFTGTTTGQAIGRLNGAGPRKDWADNDDGVVQDALSTGDPLPPGGTVTGDELLADGALMWTVGNGTKGDERIAYNLGGLMEAGEEITLSFNLFNHVPYYNQIAGYLYDRTTGTQLMADPWVSSKAWSDPAYTPVDSVVTYTCPPENDGHELAIVFREWHNHTNRVGYFDNISVTSTAPGGTGVLVCSNVFVGGEEGSLGTSNYRIPSIAVAPNGDLLAFAEARRSSSDAGAAGYPIDMVMKRSDDGGRTWTDYTVLQSSPSFDYSDPRAVVDENTGTIHLLYTQWPDDCGQSCVGAGLGDDSSQTFHQYSTDNGLTWSGPTNITAQVKDPTWEMLNTGPGIGVQLRYQDAYPERNGRLVIPGHRRNGDGVSENVSIYSDDGGTTWQTGSAVPTGASEAEVVELTSGDLLVDIRRTGYRKRAISDDGGVSWGSAYDGDVSMTACDAGLLRYSAVRDGDDRDRILFSAPLGTPVGSGSDRTNMGVWTSYDEGKTFINPVQLDTGHGAYSALEKLNDGTIGLIWEATSSTVIQFKRFNIQALEGATHHPTLSHYEGFDNEVDAFRGGVGWSGAWENYGVSVESGDLAFPGMAITGDTKRAHLRGDSMSRNLGTRAIDLDTDQSYYLSLFVEHESTDGADSGNEFLEIALKGDTGSAPIVFGVASDERFFITSLGETVTSAPGAALRDTTYLVLAKLVAQESGAGSFDQLFVAWYDDPAEVPQSEAQVNWQLVGDTSEDLSDSITQLSIAAGAEADWLVDGLRIGGSFDAVMALDPVLGDFDGDRDVDAADLLVWQRGFDTLYDESDLAVWRDQFAASSAHVASRATAVPEASSLILVVAFGLTVSPLRTAKTLFDRSR